MKEKRKEEDDCPFSNIEDDCPFCDIEGGAHGRIIDQSDDFYLIYSLYAVSKGHALIIPKRHMKHPFHMSSYSWVEFGNMLEYAYDYLGREYSPDGWNIGWNVFSAGGQTIQHAHCHIIPRYKGDVEDPRGGIRHVIPEKANYMKGKEKDEN
jgi:diadenosine tetraphosphate (Ap4A) HIT family hydrolase